MSIVDHEKVFFDRVRPIFFFSFVDAETVKCGLKLKELENISKLRRRKVQICKISECSDSPAIFHAHTYMQLCTYSPHFTACDIFIHRSCPVFKLCKRMLRLYLTGKLGQLNEILVKKYDFLA